MYIVLATSRLYMYSHWRQAITRDDDDDDPTLLGENNDCLYKNEKVLQGCSSVAATMQQSNMYAKTGGDKVAN